MSIAIIQSKSQTTAGGTTCTATFDAPTTAGSYIVAVAMFYTNTATISIDDDQTNTYSVLRAADRFAPDQSCSASWITAAAAGTAAVTVHFNQSYAQLVIFEITGLDPSTPLADSSFTNQTATTSLVAGNVTTGRAGTLLLMFSGTPNNTVTFTSTGGFTKQQQLVAGGMCLLAQTKIAGAGGVYNSTATASTAMTSETTLLALQPPAPTTFAISGNAGAAGVFVKYEGTNTGIVVADGSGDYTTPLLPNGDYTITPISTVFTFSPATSDQTVAGADITGVDFVATATRTTLIFGELAADTFLGSNVNPLDAANWTTIVGDQNLQVLNQKAVGTATDDFSGALYTNATWTAGQYLEVVINTIGGTESALLYVITDNAFDKGYQLFIQNNGGDFTATLSDIVTSDVIFTQDLDLTGSDVIRLEVYLGIITLFVNGAQVKQVSNSVWTAAGDPGIEVFIKSGGAVTDVSYNYFSAGSITGTYPVTSWSPVDSRAAHTFPTFPNTGVTQPDGSVFYIGQTSSNSTLPPVDSRAAGAPVDSRVDIPVNSRVDPASL